MKKIILVLFVALFSVAVADAQQPKKGEKKTVTTTFVTDIDCEGCAKKVTNTIPFQLYPIPQTLFLTILTLQITCLSTVLITRPFPKLDITYAPSMFHPIR